MRAEGAVLDFQAAPQYFALIQLDTLPPTPVDNSFVLRCGEHIWLDGLTCPTPIPLDMLRTEHTEKRDLDLDIPKLIDDSVSLVTSLVNGVIDELLGISTEATPSSPLSTSSTPTSSSTRHTPSPPLSTSNTKPSSSAPSTSTVSTSTDTTTTNTVTSTQTPTSTSAPTESTSTDLPTTQSSTPTTSPSTTPSTTSSTTPSTSSSTSPSTATPTSTPSTSSSSTSAPSTQSTSDSSSNSTSSTIPTTSDPTSSPSSETQSSSTQTSSETVSTQSSTTTAITSSTGSPTTTASTSSPSQSPTSASSSQTSNSPTISGGPSSSSSSSVSSDSTSSDSTTISPSPTSSDPPSSSLSPSPTVSPSPASSASPSTAPSTSLPPTSSGSPSTLPSTSPSPTSSGSPSTSTTISQSSGTVLLASSPTTSQSASVTGPSISPSSDRPVSSSANGTTSGPALSNNVPTHTTILGTFPSQTISSQVPTDSGTGSSVSALTPNHHLATIIGSVLGVLAFLLLLFCLYFCRRRQHQKGLNLFGQRLELGETPNAWWKLEDDGSPAKARNVMARVTSGFMTERVSGDMISTLFPSSWARNIHQPLDEAEVAARVPFRRNVETESLSEPASATSTTFDELDADSAYASLRPIPGNSLDVLGFPLTLTPTRDSTPCTRLNDSESLIDRSTISGLTMTDTEESEHTEYSTTSSLHFAAPAQVHTNDGARGNVSVTPTFHYSVIDDVPERLGNDPTPRTLSFNDSPGVHFFSTMAWRTPASARPTLMSVLTSASASGSGSSSGQGSFAAE